MNLELLSKQFSLATQNAKQSTESEKMPLDEFYAKIIEIFSISALNSKFYAKIAELFLRLLRQCNFPQSAVWQDKRAFCLRLICRLLFCKFLEKKGLIDERLWDTTLAQNYYHELLEPLFFATLNTPQNQRDYLKYGVLNEDLKHLLNAIPYLNGGLFSVQKNDFFNTQNPTLFLNELSVPNACIKDFFELLKSYHFSIDEGSVNVQIVGLNPELLGLVFENLLAQLSSNEDEQNLTKSLESDIQSIGKTSQRKATGSYYTPREIVSYMVRQSLFAYLKNSTKIHEKTLNDLCFSQDAPSLERAKKPSF